MASAAQKIVTPGGETLILLPETEPEHFFDLDAMDDPQDLLTRSTELALAFREAADRAMEFQAIAAAQLADPKRFDRLPIERIAERSWKRRPGSIATNARSS